MTNVENKLSWPWGLLFIALGVLLNLVDLHRSRLGLDSVLQAIGMLLMFPLASRPFSCRHGFVVAAAFVGLLLVIFSPFVR